MKTAIKYKQKHVQVRKKENLAAAQKKDKIAHAVIVKNKSSFYCERAFFVSFTP